MYLFLLFLDSLIRVDHVTVLGKDDVLVTVLLKDSLDETLLCECGDDGAYGTIRLLDCICNVFWR